MSGLSPRLKAVFDRHVKPEVVHQTEVIAPEPPPLPEATPGPVPLTPEILAFRRRHMADAMHHAAEIENSLPYRDR